MPLILLSTKSILNYRFNRKSFSLFLFNIVNMLFHSSILLTWFQTILVIIYHNNLDYYAFPASLPMMFLVQVWSNNLVYHHFSNNKIIKIEIIYKKSYILDIFA